MEAFPTVRLRLYYREYQALYEYVLTLREKLLAEYCREPQGVATLGPLAPAMALAAMRWPTPDRWPMHALPGRKLKPKSLSIPVGEAMLLHLLLQRQNPEQQMPELLQIVLDALNLALVNYPTRQLLDRQILLRLRANTMFVYDAIKEEFLNH